MIFPCAINIPATESQISVTGMPASFNSHAVSREEEVKKEEKPAPELKKEETKAEEKPIPPAMVAKKKEEEKKSAEVGRFEPNQEGSAKVYSGRKLSLDFKDADIKNILRLIAEVSNLNIIAGDDVSGKITMRLVDVPWDQALELILQARNLGMT